MIPWAEAEASGLLFALMPCITNDCNFPLHVGKQFQLTNCWLLVLYIPLTLEKCSELVLTWMGWKGDLFCQNLCLVQLEVHVDEGPGGDGSMCVCQLPWFLLFLKYPAVTSVSRSVRGEDIFFSIGNFQAVEVSVGVFGLWMIWRKSLPSWIITPCAATCDSLPWRFSRVLQTPLAPSADSGEQAPRQCLS